MEVILIKILLIEVIWRMVKFNKTINFFKRTFYQKKIQRIDFYILGYLMDMVAFM